MKGLSEPPEVPAVETYPPELCLSLQQWFSTLLMMRSFNTIPHVAVTPPNHEIIAAAIL